MNKEKLKLYLFFILIMLSSEEPLNISFESPASMWEETLPLGNGRLGAMPDGGILKETLVLMKKQFGQEVNGILLILRHHNGFQQFVKNSLKEIITWPKI